MATLSLTGNSRLSWSLADAQTIGTAGRTAEIKTSRTVENGTGAGQANAAWVNRVTIASGQVYSLELRNLGETVFGFAGKVVLTKLKEIICVVNTTTASRYVLFGVIGPSDTSAYVARINRGGDYRVADYQDGWTVTQDVNDVIYIANPSAGSVEIDIGVVGVGSYANT